MAQRRGPYDQDYGNGGGQQYQEDYPPRGYPKSPRGQEPYGGQANGGPGDYGGRGGPGGRGETGYSSAMSQRGGQQVQNPYAHINVPDLIATLQDIFKKRGGAGIKQFRRMFKIFDRGIDDRKLTGEELFHGLQHYGANFSKEQCSAIVHYFSKDGDDTLSFDEFMIAVRPPLSKSRKELIEKAFRHMDKTGDGVITPADLKNNFKVDQHPKYKSGEWTAKKCYEEFLTSFEPEHGNKDGVVTKQEWEDYYCGVSSSIDKDVYFDFMMRQSWKF